MKRVVEVKPEIRQAFESKIVEIVDKCKAEAGNINIPIPKLIFRQSGERAGVCSVDPLEGTTIYINSDYFIKNYDEQLNCTLPHEVAHHISKFLFDHMGHGHPWLRIMEWIGADPEVKHDMDMTYVVQKAKVAHPFHYTCPCGHDHRLTLTKHNRIQLKGHRRICKLCGGFLFYKRQTTNGITIPRVSAPSPVKVNVEVVKPIPSSGFKVITRFENGTLVSVRVPLTEAEKAI